MSAPDPRSSEEEQVKRFNCTSGGAQFCQGCYQMERDDEHGDYVSFEDYERLTAERDLYKQRAEQAEMAAKLNADTILQMQSAAFDLLIARGVRS
jgi:hypothetical protein